MDKRRLLTVRVTEQEYQKLFRFAESNKLSISEQVRRYIKAGVSIDAYQNDEEKILDNMKSALQEVLKPHVERLAAISAKNAISSSTDMLYTSMLLYLLMDDSLRPRMENFMEEARLLAIHFVKQQKGSIADFLNTSTGKLISLWERG